jgi:hypothetical protein
VDFQDRPHPRPTGFIADAERRCIRPPDPAVKANEPHFSQSLGTALLESCSESLTPFRSGSDEVNRGSIVRFQRPECLSMIPITEPHALYANQGTVIAKDPEEMRALASVAIAIAQFGEWGLFQLARRYFRKTVTDRQSLYARGFRGT